MEYLSIKDQRKATLSSLREFLLSHNFVHKDEHSPVDLFVKKMSFGFVTLQFRFRRTESIDFHFWLTFDSVEEIMISSGFADIDPTDHKTLDRYLFNTVVNSRVELGYDYKVEGISSHNELDKFTTALRNYLMNEGLAFIEEYSTLDKVLVEMNRLEHEGLNWNGLYGRNGILGGGLRAFLRGLAISRLCNDQDYERKLELVYNIFEGRTEWLVCYSKLKNVLSQLK